MKTVFKFALLAALIALGVWLWFILFPSPEEIVRNHLAKIARDVSFSKSEGNLTRITRAESVSGFFSTNVEVNVNVPGRIQHRFVGRAEITQAALDSPTFVKGLAVKFPDVNVTLAPDEQSATADVTLEVNVAGERDPIVQELKITFQKLDGDWLITRLETVRTLS
ncbi:MAG: hypothetical protein ACREFE_01420 [Limisphaerales bacterium]